MDKDEKECDSYIVKTLFSHSYKKEEKYINLFDTCYIYRNDDSWVALSLNCSKVGQGYSYKEAYIDLVTSIFYAICYYVKNKPDEEVDIGPKQPVAKFIESQNGCLMKENIQLELLLEVVEKIEECFFGKKDNRTEFDKYEIDGNFELTPIFCSVRGVLISYCSLRKPLPLWEGRNETLNQPKADEYLF